MQSEALVGVTQTEVVPVEVMMECRESQGDSYWVEPHPGVLPLPQMGKAQGR